MKLHINTSSGRFQVFQKIDALENFAKFTGKHAFWSLFVIKRSILL